MRGKRLMLLGAVLVWAGLLTCCSGYAPDFGVGAQLANGPDAGSEAGEAGGEASE